MTVKKGPSRYWELRREAAARGIDVPSKGVTLKDLERLLDNGSPERKPEAQMPDDVQRALRLCCRHLPNAGRKVRNWIREQLQCP